jgi:uncharacterized OsmC-like protein
MCAMEEIVKKTVTLTREAEGVYVARNAAGAELRFGHNVEGGFGAVELLLAAIAGCSGTDLDVMTTRRAEPDVFEATVTADKVGGSSPAILRDIDVAFRVEFPPGEDGDKARARIPAALKAAEERTCTVSRTVVHGANVTLRTVERPAGLSPATPVPAPTPAPPGAC